MSIITIIGAGMMGSALAFPARENGHTVRLTGTPLDKDIINCAKTSGQHPKFDRPFPAGVEYYQFDEVENALENCDLWNKPIISPSGEQEQLLQKENSILCRIGRSILAIPFRCVL